MEPQSCQLVIGSSENRFPVAAKWSPNCEFLAVATSDGDVAVWHRDRLSSVWPHDSAQTVHGLEWSPSSRYFSLCYDFLGRTVVAVHNIVEERLERVFVARSCAGGKWSIRDRLWFSDESSLQSWDPVNKTINIEHTLKDRGVETEIEICPRGRFVAVHSGFTLRIFDARDREQRFRGQCHLDRPSDMYWGADPGNDRPATLFACVPSGDCQFTSIDGREWSPVYSSNGRCTRGHPVTRRSVVRVCRPGCGAVVTATRDASWFMRMVDGRRFALPVHPTGHDGHYPNVKVEWRSDGRHVLVLCSMCGVYDFRIGRRAAATRK